jgi:hypothetical protein
MIFIIKPAPTSPEICQNKKPRLIQHAAQDAAGVSRPASFDSLLLKNKGGENCRYFATSIHVPGVENAQ